MATIINYLQLAAVLDNIKKGIIWFFLFMDSIIYTFVNFMFKLFLVLAQADIFTDESMSSLIYRIYQLIGVIMLFMLSYAILKKIVNPESNDKESVGKIIINVVKAIVLLAIVPTIFSYAFIIQNAVLKQNTIGKLILGTSGVNTINGTESPNEVVNRGGITLAQGVFEAFLFPTQGDRNVEVIDGMSFDELSNEVQQSGNFTPYRNVADKVVDGTLTYYSFICFVAGIVVLYFLLTYCISLGFRVIKLAFYEIMAPVCIIASILPSKKDMLNNWIKTTLQVFLETFIRIAILYFVIYILELLRISFSKGNLFPGADFKLKALGWVAIVMGLIAFMKSAPDLISKLTGIDSSNMGLNFKDQLAKGGFFTAGAMAGGAITSGLRNLVSAGAPIGEHARKYREYRKNMKEASTDAERNRLKNDYNSEKKNLRKKARHAVLPMIGSTIAGTVSGGFHSFNSDAKNFGDLKESASKGARQSAKNRDARDARQERYRAEGDNWFTKKAVAGHLRDWRDSIKDYASDGAAQFESDIETGKKYSEKSDAVKSAAEEFKSKHRNSTALVQQDVARSGRKDEKNFWSTNDDENRKMAEIFTSLASAGDVSLSAMDEYLTQLQNIGVDREGFYESVTQADGTTLRQFKQNDYERAVNENARKIARVREMITKLDKEANSLIINASAIGRVNGDGEVIIHSEWEDDAGVTHTLDKAVSDTKASDLLSTKGAIEDFKTAVKLAGNTVVDKSDPNNPKRVTVKIEDNDPQTAKKIKEFTDAAKATASVAQQKATAYEEKKKARESGKKDRN